MKKPDSDDFDVRIRCDTLNQIEVGATADSPDFGIVLPSNGALKLNNNIRFGTYSTNIDPKIGLFQPNSNTALLVGMEIEKTTLGGNYSQKLHFRTYLQQWKKVNYR